MHGQGILSPIAKPQIQPLPTCSFNQNAPATPVTIQVKNIGTTAGTLLTSLSCTGISVTPINPVSQTYEAGATLANQFRLTSTNSGSYTCTVTSQSADGTQKDTQPISCLVGQQCTLQPYNGYILDSAKCVLVCPTDLYCGENQVLDSSAGVCECVAKPNTPTGTCSLSTALLFGIGILAFGLKSR